MLSRFKARNTRVLVATDVLSRGIDIKDIDLVINFDVPSDAEDYVHRVGRTARAENTGAAITLVSRTDMQKMQRIEKLIGYKVYNSPLPSFIAGIEDKSTGHRPVHKKSDKGGFKRIVIRNSEAGNRATESPESYSHFRFFLSAFAASTNAPYMAFLNDVHASAVCPFPACARASWKPKFRFGCCITFFQDRVLALHILRLCQNSSVCYKHRQSNRRGPCRRRILLLY